MSGREQLLLHVVEVEHPVCLVCEQVLQLAEAGACESCLADARAALSGILDLWRELAASPRPLGSNLGRSGPRGASDGRPLPGGDALVLIGPGSPGYAEDKLTSKDGDPTSVAFELGWWADEWRERRGDVKPRPARLAKALGRDAGYLEVQARWAAVSHPGFADFSADLHLLHGRLERATGRARKPLRANVACFDCGRPLLKLDSDEHGVEEEFTCVGCHRRYDDVAYTLALRQELFRASSFELDGVTFSTRELVAARVSRSKHTIRQWMSAQVVRTHVRGGIRYVCLEDVVAEDERRQRRARSSA